MDGDLSAGSGMDRIRPDRSLSSAHLVAVAVTRDITRIAPVSGSFSGGADALLLVSVEVRVSPRDAG